LRKKTKGGCPQPQTMRKIHCLREWRAGSAALYFINFGTVEAPTRKKRFSHGRRPKWFLRGQPSWTQASPRGPAPTALQSATRHRGMPGCLQESTHLKPGSRLLAALDECVALKSTIKSASGQQKPTFRYTPVFGDFALPETR
jgi:hypothetical protein